MRRMLIAIAAFALASCSSGGEGPTAENSDTAAPTPTPLTIPDTMQGRWGLVANDCTGPASDAKGLLTIGPDSLRFYESVGTLAQVTEVGADHIRGTFDFTGEGMEWKRDMQLETRMDGEQLLRSEFGADALQEPLTYMRCM